RLPPGGVEGRARLRAERVGQLVQRHPANVEAFSLRARERPYVNRVAGVAEGASEIERVVPDAAAVGGKLAGQQVPDHAALEGSCRRRRRTCPSFDTCASAEKAAAAARAPADSRAWTAASPSTAAMASPRAVAPPSGLTRRPLTSCASHSAIPPTSNATAGTPNCAASRPTRPNGSGQMLGMTAIEAPANIRARCASLIQPGSSTLMVPS